MIDRQNLDQIVKGHRKTCSYGPKTCEKGLRYNSFQGNTN